MKDGFYPSHTPIQRISAIGWSKLAESRSKFLNHLAQKHFIKAQLSEENYLKKNAPDAECLDVLLEVLKDYRNDPQSAKAVVGVFSIYKNNEALVQMRKMGDDSEFFWATEVKEAIEEASRSNIVLSRGGDVTVEPRMGAPRTVPTRYPIPSVEHIIKTRAALQMKQNKFNLGVAELEKARKKLDKFKRSIFMWTRDVDEILAHLREACQHDSSLESKADKMGFELFSICIEHSLDCAFNSYSAPDLNTGAHWIGRAREDLGRVKSILPRELYAQLREHYFEVIKGYFLTCYKANNMLAAKELLTEMKSLDRKKTNTVEESASKILIDE